MNFKNNERYDYIIAGAGCAGLSLLYRVLQEPKLRQKRILVLDKEPKVNNDKTWCFWETEKGLFSPIIYHKWKKLNYYSTSFEKKLNLGNYEYKMIRSIDFYNHILNFAKKFTNVGFQFGDIQNIGQNAEDTFVTTTEKTFQADFIFNSTTLFNPKMDTSNSLLQHFKGWVIRTPKDCFDKDIGTLMDFRLSQKNGATFMYVLPTANNEALIEYTLFSPTLLEDDEYEIELKQYIKEYLQINEYEIISKEFGIIPMSLAKFQNPENTDKIINIGTAGGWTKASSGYTFQFIQKNSIEIVNSLLNNENPNKNVSFEEKKHNWYDRTLLDVLISKKMTGKDVFDKMFKALPATTILKFLDNESSLVEDVKILSRFPLFPFLKSGIKQLNK